MTVEFLQFEHEIMRKLLEGDDPVLAVLREQWKASRVIEREFTGVGFFTTFAVPSAAPKLQTAGRLAFGDVMADIAGLSHGAGFVVFVNDGVLTMLEGYTYDEPWPENIESFTLTYRGSNTRDWDEFRKELSG